MPIIPFLQHEPHIHTSSFIAPSADVIGRVTIGEEASIWYNATLRGDINDITIGPRSNVQDNACVHLADEYGCHVGELVTIGHSAIIHACTIADECLVGMGSVILDGAEIGPRCIVGAGALVTGGKIFPEGSLILGSPAKVVKTLSAEEQANIKNWALKYVRQSRLFIENETRMTEASPKNSGI